MIWGDMFLRPSDFPEMNCNSLAEYFYKAIDSIPKDIIIVDWHYSETKDFSSIDYFQKKGFQVLGATWKKKKNIFAFSKYVYSLKAKPLGMVATTWFHFNREERGIIDNILKWSAEAYWNGGSI
jgi:hypothetical protein